MSKEFFMHDHSHDSKELSHKNNSSCCCNHEHHENNVDRLRNVSLLIAAIATGLGFIAEYFLKMSLSVTTSLYLVGIASGGWFLLPEAIRSVLKLRPNINALMVVASVGAAIIGAWGEAAVVVILFGVAEWLEGYSVEKARKAISRLLDLTPLMARVKENDDWTEKPLQEVLLDNIIEILPGERVPLDSLVQEGISDVNQAPITGEPLPVDKKAGDTLYAGTLNGSGVLIAKVLKLHNDSTLAKIIRLVKEAEEQRAPTQRFIEKFAAIYTPLVPILALLVFAIPVFFMEGDPKEWAYRAFTILVIACPCALVVSTPVSIVCGLTVLASRGVLIKGGAFLELIGRMKALAVDKTGTITKGQPHVAEIVLWKAKSKEEVLRIAATLDAKSSHPLADAIVKHAATLGLRLESVNETENLAGKGNRGLIHEHRYFVGNHRLVHDLGVCSPELEDQLAKLQEKGFSVVVVGHHPHDNCDGEVLGILAIGDEIRPDAPIAIDELHRVGVEKIVMLSGDNQKAASTVAAQVGISDAKGDMLPENKMQEIHKLKERYGVVGMIGDGINDAPALAASSFGIAMGASGSDTAIETADVALMKDDLRQLPIAIKTSRRVLKIIQFNIAFAVTLKLAFLILGITGHTSLWLAIFADTGATVLVVLNAMRLLKRAN